MPRAKVRLRRGCPDAESGGPAHLLSIRLESAIPDITVYLEALEARVLGRSLEAIRLASPFLLRSVDPAPAEAEGRSVVGLRRIGKRIVLELEGDLYLVLHLMVAGRLHWKASGCAIPKKRGLAAFDFAEGSLLLTEAGSRRKASLHMVSGEEALAAHDPGGSRSSTPTCPSSARR